MRVLVVEDDPRLAELLARSLRERSYAVDVVGDGEAALVEAVVNPYDAVILDVVLPGRSGIEVCRELRRRGAECPILMLTGRSAKIDVVVGLEVGADEYITKPLDARELTARLAAHLRRVHRTPRASRAGIVRVGEVEIDTEGRRVRVGRREVNLTLTEFNLLALLAANPGRVLTRSQMLEKVWGYLAEVDHHSVDPHVQRLRRKLGEQGDCGVTLEAVPGLGYRLSPGA